VSPRVATTGLFVVNGAVIGVWVSQIPWIQQRFGLSSIQVGLVILCMSLAVIVAVPVAGQAVARRGSRPVAVAGGAACVAAVNLPVLAPTPLLTAAALVVLGGASAAMDVAMNSHGVHIEITGGRPIMSSLHAGWAFGGMIAAAFVALLTALSVDARVTGALASVLLAAVVAFALLRVGGGSAAAGEDSPGFTLPSRSVVLLAVLCLLTMVTEGAMGDWGGIYLRQDLGSATAVAALAYAFFTAGMTFGRVVGDRVNAAIGPVRLLRLGALLTAVPLAATLVIGVPLVALAGLFLVGLGVANGVPLMFSAAGRQPDVPSGVGIAAVSSMGSLGFLAGPPVIGFIAQAVSLPWALSILCVGAVAVFALAARATGGARPAQAQIEADFVTSPTPSPTVQNSR
jgi:fucose permease